MPKIKVNENIHDVIKYHHTQYLFFCKGCGHEHAFGLKNHRFNMDLNNPTVVPSILQNFSPDKLCHSYITNGNIQYLGDCHHHLAGKTIELPEIES